MGYRNALFLAVLFILVKAFMESILVSPFFFAPSWFVEEYRNYLKLLLSISFLVPVLFLNQVQKKISGSSLPVMQTNPYDGTPTRGFWRHPFTWITLLLGFGVSFQIFGTQSELIYKQFDSCDESLVNFMKFIAPTGHPVDALGAVVTIGLIGPLAEEIVFRGWMQNGLTRLYPRRIGLILLFQGFLFGLSHLNLWQILYAGPLGVLLGFLRYRTGNIGAPLLVHASSNLMAVFYLYVVAEPAELQNPCDAVTVAQPELLLVAVASLAVSIAHIIKNSHSGIRGGSTGP